MAFQNKRPPFRFSLSIKEFNLLIYILKYNEQKYSGLESNNSKKFWERLLQYSIPYKDKDGNELIEVGCYNNQLFYLLKDLLNYNIDEEVNINYYDTLLEHRKNFIESKNVENK